MSFKDSISKHTKITTYNSRTSHRSVDFKRFADKG